MVTLFLLTCAPAQFKYDTLINILTSKDLVNLKHENAEKLFNVSLKSDSIIVNGELHSIKLKYEAKNDKNKTVFNNLELEFRTDNNTTNFNYLRVAINSIKLKDRNVIAKRINNLLSDFKKDTTFTSIDKKKFDCNYEWELIKPYRVFLVFTSDNKMTIIVENAWQYYVNDQEYDG